jgi:hypothetical protein
MGLPEEDLPHFPVYAAEALATELDQLASKLETAIGARSRAGNNLPEFQGAVAEQFRSDLHGHVGAVNDLVARFRGTAGQLRDAVADHHELRRRLVTHAA